MKKAGNFIGSQPSDTLTFISTETMQKISDQLGNQDSLIQHIQRHPRIESAEGIFALYQQGLLTPANFDQLTQCDDQFLSDISMILKELLKNQLLNQSNFDLLMQYKNMHPKIIVRFNSSLMGRKHLNSTKPF